MNVCLFGFGYWGKNLARCIDESEKFNLAYIIDTSEENLNLAKKSYPDCHSSADVELPFTLNDVEAVVISSPASTHFFLCARAVQANKHVLVTKPLTVSYKEALQLQELQKKSKNAFVVDHTFLYSDALKLIKDTLLSGRLGRPVYYDSLRCGLGIYKNDVSVVEDLAIHDIAILAYLFDDMPISALSIFNNSMWSSKPDICSLSFKFRDGFFAKLHASWLSPIKQRLLVIAGDKKMLVWHHDDEPGYLRLYDVGVKQEDNDIQMRSNLSYFDNGFEYLEYDKSEPLKNELEDFWHVIQTGEEPVSNISTALKTMSMLEMALS